MLARVYSKAEITDAWTLIDQFGAFFARFAWIPLTFILWMFTPKREVQVLIPGQEYENDISVYRGFPLLQESDFPGFSLWAYVYVAPLMLNLAFFAGLAFLATHLFAQRTVLKHRAIDWALGVPTYVIGGFLGFVTIVFLFVLDTFLVPWVDTSEWRRVQEGFVLFT